MPQYDLAQVVMFLRRYGPLMEYLEDNSGYGEYVLNMHGRVPRKIARMGRVTVLPVLKDEDVELDLTHQA